MVEVALTVRRRDDRFVLAGYAIMLDRRRVGRLEDGETLKTTVEPGEHIICARRLLNYGPPLSFSVTAAQVDLECGFSGGRLAGFMSARFMRWVRFRILHDGADRIDDA
jgi:hypothetical protein